MSGELVERLRGSAKAFRENPVYDSDGNGAYLRAQADELDEAADRIEALEAKLRMIVSHASGGGSSNIEQSVNDICVRITQHVNRAYEAGQAKGTEECARALQPKEPDHG